MKTFSIQGKRLVHFVGLIIIVVIGLSATLRANHTAHAHETSGAENPPAFSSSQARRGMGPYIKECSSCHGEMFNGSESGPALSGNIFRERWTGLTAIDLFKKSQAMPPYPDTPGKLKEGEYLAIVATILQANGLPAGDTELTKESAAAVVLLFD